MSDLDAQAQMDRKRAGASAKVEHEPLPAPTIRWRVATADELASCPTAARLEKKCLALGYEVEPSYAVGPYMGSNGESLGEAEAIALSFRWSSRLLALAVWYHRGVMTDGGKKKWDGTATIARPSTKVTSTDLGHWLVGTVPKAAA